MKQKLLTIEMNTSDIKICEVVYDGKQQVDVLKFITVPTPADCITSKDIYDLDAITFEIKKALMNANIKTKDCIFIVNSSDIQGRIMNIPPQKNVAQYIEVITAKAESDNVFPVSLENNILTYTVLDKVTSNDKNVELDKNVSNITLEESIEQVKALNLDKKEESKRIKQLKKDYSLEQKNKKKSNGSKKVTSYEMMVYLAPEDYILKFVDLAKRLKLNLISIDYVGNSIYRHILNKYSSGNHLVVYLNDFNAIITIIQDGIMKIQRVTLDFSYSILAKFFYEHENLFGIKSIEECFDYIKSTKFFELTDADFAEMPSLKAADVDDFIRARNEVTNLILDFFDKLASTINQYRQDSGLDIDDIIFINERSTFPNFSESLEEITSKPVILYDSVSTDLKYKSDNNLNIFSNVGSPISPINFNIKQSEELKKHQLTYRLTFITGVFAIFVFLIYFFSILFAYQDEQQRNVTLNEQINNAREAQIIYQDFIVSEDNLFSFKEFNETTYSHLNDLDINLRVIESCIPTGRCIIDAVTCTTETITLSVTADSKSSIAKFVQELESKTYEDTVVDEYDETETVVDVPYFAIVDVSSVSESEDSEGLFTTQRTVKTSVTLTFEDIVDESDTNTIQLYPEGGPESVDMEEFEQ